MTVDESAPVVARATADVTADPETVWEVMADVERWPAWNPDVRSASLDGELAEGAAFAWKAGPGTIRSTVRRVERPRLLAWTGRTLGIRAVHVWRLEPRDGGTAVTTEESWDGLPVRLLRGRMRATLQESLDAGLRHLKAEAERRAA